MSTPNQMTYREATIRDAKQILQVRHSVNENKLSNPDSITEEDCKKFLMEGGKGWVCEITRQIVGFVLVSLVQNNVWALFIRPAYEKRGIGQKLQQLMLDWYFGQTKTKIWLCTSPDTRAESFYRRSGWKEAGTHGENEMKFEMTQKNWVKNRIVTI